LRSRACARREVDVGNSFSRIPKTDLLEPLGPRCGCRPTSAISFYLFTKFSFYKIRGERWSGRRGLYAVLSLPNFRLPRSWTLSLSAAARRTTPAAGADSFS
jgi:hypothetical protein